MEAFCRGKKSRAEPYPCKQRTAFGGLAHHICVALQHKEVRTSTIPTKTKQRGHQFGVLLFWLGWMGSNHRNARVKVWCLTAWLHPNIALVLYHILLCLSSTLLKKLFFMKNMIFHYELLYTGLKFIRLYFIL